jgi:SNF2 family DNA or RNA helicase
MTDYPWRTPPYSHQREWWDKTKDTAAWGVLWEQGTGKSKLTIDTVSHLFLAGKIDGLVVLAPNGVHRNWVLNELPTHLPKVVEKKVRTLYWQSGKAANKSAKAEAESVLKAPGLSVLAMSYHGIMTEAGDKYLHKFLTTRRCAMVLDESARIKNPRAKWTMRVLARGKAAIYRRILTGTPVSNSPFDVYAQLAFLKPDIWHSIGCSTYLAFKSFFGVWQDRVDPRSGRPFRDLVRYRNLEKLAEIVATITCRVLKEDVLDLPPKVYVTRYFDMTAEQKRMYAEMSDSYEIRHASGEVTAMLAIVQLLRFQQIVSGFLTTDEGVTIPLADNPRLALLREVVEDTQGKMIVWAKFKADIDLIQKALAEDGLEVVRYDGSTSAQNRQEAVERFQNGTAQVFLANPAAASEGLTLHAARTVIYFNNSFKLTDRLQSEDRAHRIGQKVSVTYIDLVAADTVDEGIVEALRNKLDIASSITGDRLKEWI